MLDQGGLFRLAQSVLFQVIRVFTGKVNKMTMIIINMFLRLMSRVEMPTPPARARNLITTSFTHSKLYVYSFISVFNNILDQVNRIIGEQSSWS